MAGTVKYEKEHLDAVAKGKTMTLVGMIGLGVVGVGGLALLLAKLLKKKRPALAPVDGVSA